MVGVWSDIRYAIRLLAKAPGFSTVAVLALALGIGANTAIFSVVNAILLRDLPYQNPERIVMVWGDNPSIGLEIPELPASPADYGEWRRNLGDTFERVALMQARELNLSGDLQPIRVPGAAVTQDFFEVFGRAAQLGRTLNDHDQVPGSHRVAVLAHSLWKERFGSDANVIGRKITIDHESFEIVGVMPAQFTYPNSAELPKAYGFTDFAQIWVPKAFTPEEATRRFNRSYVGLAKLRQGVAVGEANARVHALGLRVQRDHPETKGWGYKIVGFREQVVGKVQSLVLLLTLAVGFVLLIACSNVANLLLARASARTREIAVRCALGASRIRIVRQLLTESFILSMLAAAAGILLAAWGLEFLIRLSPGDVPRLHETSLDGTVLAFTLGLSVLTALLFGLAPAFQVSNAASNDGLKEGARGSAGLRRAHARNILSASEVALATVLLISAGLLIRSFTRTMQVDPGFRPDSVLTMNLVLPDKRYGDPAKVQAFYATLLRSIQSLPGVKHAGATSNLPLSGSEDMNPFVPEGTPFRRGEKLSDDRQVTPGYFQAAGVPLVRGRLFDDNDTPDRAPVAIVNETLARTFFPGTADVIGKKLQLPYGRRVILIQIVGVVKDVHHSALVQTPRPQVYRPLYQSETEDMTLVIRTTGDPLRILPDVRQAVASLDPYQPIGDIRTMQDVLSASVAPQRFTMTLLIVFAGMAVVLTVIGLYGVLAYTVSQRTREIGIRLALGAKRSEVVRDVLSRVLIYSGIGLIVGLAGALGVGRLLSSWLFRTPQVDPWTFACVPLLLALVACGAALIPAYRATRVNPVVALRHD